MGLFEKFRNGLRKTAQHLASNLDNAFKASPRISDEILADMEEKLVAADLGAVPARALVLEVQEGMKKEPKATPEALCRLLREALFQRLLRAHSPLELGKPIVILLTGVNGAGKTTTAGKLAAHFSHEGRKVLLAAGDTFRAAAEEQLTEWAERAKVEVVRGSHGASPSAVVFDALKSGL